jgi:membrane dipeptidase
MVIDHHADDTSAEPDPHCGGPPARYEVISDDRARDRRPGRGSRRNARCNDDSRAPERVFDVPGDRGFVHDSHDTGASVMGPADHHVERARAILRDAPLIDGHNDLAIALRERVGLRTSTVDLRAHVDGLDTDIPRLRAGGVGGQFWSVWVPAALPELEALRMAIEQLDVVHRFVDRYPDAFAFATTADEVERVFAAGRVASLIGLEGGSMIASSLAALRQFHARGVRYMTLTHWRTTRWADAATDAPQHDGLTPFGVEVVREMNRLGMLVDLSHVSPATMAAALDATEAPVIFSHSGARSVADHPRNVPDDILRRVPGNGGIVMMVFLSGFVSEEVSRHLQPAQAAEDAHTAEHPGATDSELHEVRRAWLADHPAPPATISQVADHIDHLRATMGVDHIGIGSDFDGGDPLPSGLEDVAAFPNLLGELLRRGYSDDDVRAIAGGNILRVMRASETVAQRLQASRSPSEATIEELDGPN